MPHDRRPLLESLENRRLLSGAKFEVAVQRPIELSVAEVRDVLPEASTAVAASFARVADLSQYDAATLETTTQWAFLGNGPIKGAAVEASDVLRGISIATFVNPATAVEALSASGSVGFYPLVAKQQQARSVPNDPLFGNQWHLRNTGQGNGRAGVDANIIDAWSRYRGEGVTIGIVDDGIHYNHPDLAPQYSAADSYDFNFNDPFPFAGSGDFHGTQSAGIAVARGFDGRGVTGSAPASEFAALRLISGPSNDSQESSALSYRDQNIDIYSNSWGPPDDGRRFEAPGPLTMATLEQTATTGRGGLGGIITWAGGNGGSNDNANRDGYANSRHTISVAAVDNFGRQAFYSERGANHLVTAPSSGGSLGTTTTDGSSSFTSNFGGTSSATPLVSGVVALMLEANPDLTQRDVQHILVRSAATINPSDPTWEINGAGLTVSEVYGHGLIDATAAVDLAQTWETVAEEVSVSAAQSVNRAIPDNNSVGITQTLTLDPGVTLEHVEIFIDIDHAYRGDLQINLTSPDGTTSQLLTPTFDSNNNIRNWVFSSTQHWGEDSGGVWTLNVADLGPSDLGGLRSWGLTGFGTQVAEAVNIVARGFDVDAKQAVSFGFDADVSTELRATDLVLSNLDSGQIVPTLPTVSWSASTQTATFGFNGQLPDGNYRATLAATDGLDLSAPGHVEFFILAGDANRDRTVNLEDFGILRANFGSDAGLFSEADFNYDGRVDLADFGILRGNFGEFLPEPVAEGPSLFADNPRRGGLFGDQTGRRIGR
jgi:subtilisin-like proprotein convertase family protein